MIRSVFVLVSAFLSVSAYATPKVGDFALFDAVLSLNGNALTATVEQEILQFDAVKNQFLEKQIVTLEGSPAEVSQAWKPASDYLDDDTVAAILADCAKSGGTPETVTLAGKQIDTCAVVYDNESSLGTVWVAKDIPFGAVRVDSFNKGNGLLVSMILKAYR